MKITLVNQSQTTSGMAAHQNFSVRSSAASICMDLGHSAPALVPLDILLKLVVYDEDWYVEAPAAAALKAMARSFPDILDRNDSAQHAQTPAINRAMMVSASAAISRSDASAAARAFADASASSAIADSSEAFNRTTSNASMSATSISGILDP